MTERRKLKAWATYSGASEWYHCVLVAEDGWAIASHICSHPFYAPGDLWTTRPERHQIVEAMGFELELQSDILRDTDLPKEILDAHRANEAEWKRRGQEWNRLRTELGLKD